jgi:integrase/recombinase XerD
MRALNPLRRQGGKPIPPPRPDADNPLHLYRSAYLEWMGVISMSAHTVRCHDSGLLKFIAWCDERGLTQPQEITLPMIERYQKHLYHYRKSNGQALSLGSQIAALKPIRPWFKWLTRNRYIGMNPASELVLPKKPSSLPRSILSLAEIENILNQCDVGTPLGMRNRAMFEVLYSSGIRRMEAVQLKLWDIDIERGTLMVRHGKGNKDRLLPLGERACAWLRRYIEDVRPLLESGNDDGILFLYELGGAIPPDRLSDLVKRHMQNAGVPYVGACHLFRHACATHMLEGGADIRFIQEMLGHVCLDTTQIYTRVSIDKLKAIHTATHPARLERVRGDQDDLAGCGIGDEAQALLDALDDD